MNESEYLRLCAIKLPQSILFYQTSVRGYHDYMSAWPTPKRGELLSCIADPKNPWSPFQVIYEGKTPACHPNVNFPHLWNVTHTESHWSNHSTMVEFVQKILIPFRLRKIEEFGFPDDQKLY